MKMLSAMLLGAGMLVALPSHADSGQLMLGAGLGGALGAVVGHQIGGHDGAIVGGALGAATGAAVAYDSYGRPVRYVERYERYPEPYYGRGPVTYVYVDDERGYGHRHHHHHRHHHGYRDSGAVIIVR
ncbi:glycine zipper 2TM domain-containing protein [Thiofaba sp. EF100]|uniref:glycine zipper 2TM domain-containing protein n=1 Tax=Thiofaba sp. EF100 TaxID=3121274 RepID=UPI0032216902